MRSFKVSSIGEDCADLLATAYAGDDAITNVSGFVMFLAYDCGLDNDTIIAVCDNLDLPLYTDALAQVRENLAIRSPELRLLDAIRNAE